MGLEIALATYIGHQCTKRDKVKSISDRMEVFEAIQMAENSHVLTSQAISMS